MNREIKVQFIVDNKHLSASYTLTEVLNAYDEKVFEDMEGPCTCMLTESTNHCEGDCSKYEKSVITGQRQFTGLTDKNNKEVFEGDVYHQGDMNIKYVVVWHDTGFKGKQIGSSSFAGLEYWKDRIEIIGNIYETPELSNPPTP